jgi:hypothetical protein
MVDQQGSLSVYLDEGKPVHFQSLTGFMKQITEFLGNEARHVIRSCYLFRILWPYQVGNLGRGPFIP